MSVCLCRLLQLLKDQRSASKSFNINSLLVMFSWILTRGFEIMLRSRVMAIDLLTWNALVAFSEQCEAKLVHVVLLLYLLVSSALER